MNKAKMGLSAVVLLLAAALLFCRLGGYALWGDEALTALAGKGVLATGDTTAVMANGNLLAYDSGKDLKDLKLRGTPPLSSYMAAVGMACLGDNSFASRLPAALAGWLCVALLLYWARSASTLYFGVFCLAILGNVSFFLFCRQCRYYSAVILMAAAVVYFYWNWKRGNRRDLWAMSIASFVLFSAHYLAYLALYACLLVDYIFWKRKESPLIGADWMVLLLPQIIFNGVIGWIWNPLATDFRSLMLTNNWGDRVMMFFWNLRDLDSCEFCSLPLLFVGFVAALYKKEQAYLRGCVAIVIACAVIAALTPQVRQVTFVADVRYLVFLIPLCMALGAGAICLLLPQERKVAMLMGPLVGGIIFFTNFLHAAPFFDWIPSGWRSTSLCYLRELRNPPNTDPYTKTAEWIRQNVQPGNSIYVEPFYHNYALMFEAPDAIYAWQFRGRTPQAAKLASIHIKGESLPDYLIGFGPDGLKLLQQNLTRYGFSCAAYRTIAKVDVFCQDMYRPELFWRSFSPITGYNHDTYCVFVLQRSGIAYGKAK